MFNSRIPARDQFLLDPSVTYLNTGTSGLIPRSIHQKAILLREQLHSNPMNYVWRAMGEMLGESRSRLAAHFHCPFANLVFFNNVTEAINVVCSSAPFKSTDNVLISNHEYGSLRRAWERSAKSNNFELVPVDLPIQSNSEVDYVEAFRSRIDSNTRAIYLSHVLYTTGHVLPLAEIVKMARENNVITIVDGAHGAGFIPIDFQKLNPDIYVTNLHKWFFSPVGSAVMYLSDAMKNWLEPSYVSWGYEQDYHWTNAEDRANEFGSTNWIRRFELVGTRDLTPWFLSGDCCRFVEAIGYDSIRARHFELASFAREKLERFCELRCVTPNRDSMRGGLTAFQLTEEIDGHAVRNRLWKDFRIEVNLIDHPSHSPTQYLRISTHVYNTEQELVSVANALEKILCSV